MCPRFQFLFACKGLIFYSVNSTVNFLQFCGLNLCKCKLLLIENFSFNVSSFEKRKWLSKSCFFYLEMLLPVLFYSLILGENWYIIILWIFTAGNDNINFRVLKSISKYLWNLQLLIGFSSPKLMFIFPPIKTHTMVSTKQHHPDSKVYKCSHISVIKAIQTSGSQCCCRRACIFTYPNLQAPCI